MGRDTMKHFDAARTDAPALHCYYCGRLIAEGNWFARFERDGHCIALCRPQCVESLFEHPERCAGAPTKQTAIAPDWASNFNHETHAERGPVVVGSSEACAS